MLDPIGAHRRHLVALAAPLLVANPAAWTAWLASPEQAGLHGGTFPQQALTTNSVWSATTPRSLGPVAHLLGLVASSSPGTARTSLARTVAHSPRLATSSNGLATPTSDTHPPGSAAPSPTRPSRQASITGQAMSPRVLVPTQPLSTHVPGAPPPPVHTQRFSHHQRPRYDNPRHARHPQGTRSTKPPCSHLFPGSRDE